MLDHVPFDAGKRVEPGADERAHAGRDAAQVEVGVRSPASVDEHEDLRLDQEVDELLEQQRVAAGGVEDALLGGRAEPWDGSPRSGEVLLRGSASTTPISSIPASRSSGSRLTVR